jgi:small subunit ribosomal protein S20
LANTESAKKRIRSSHKKRARNIRFRTAARTYVKKTRKFIAAGELESADEAARQAVITLDKAARKGIIHPRNAARRKSRLMKRLAAAQREN